MYLKALELSGFKSFADKTIIEFNRGITSIVGPNGSGKSNILDAILWVLGEQSYKNIRAKESADVIFSGGKNKKAKSMAEVSLIIENEDRYLDIDFSEVKITRRIYKSSENEYLINNRKVRLKDINNLFMDTGIGKQAYSIIGQGRVERIISSNPKELKEIIEEAAGVKRAKIEKEDSIKKLKEVKNEIEKIEYVEKDLENRVKYLKEESMKAKLFKTYTNKIETQKFMILEYNIDEKLNLKNQYDEEKEKLDVELSLIRSKFNAHEKELELVNEKRENYYKRLENEKNENKNIFTKVENLKDDFVKLNNKLSNLETEATEKSKRKDVVEKDLKEKNEILENSKKELKNIKENFINVKKEKNELENKVESLKNEKEILLSNLKKNKEKNQNYEVDKVKLNYENQDLEKRILTGNNEIKRLQNEKNYLVKEFSEIEKNKEKFENEKILQEKIKKEKEKEILEIENLLSKLNLKYNEINKEKNNIFYKLENLNSKKRVIKNIIENNETFYKGVKYLLNNKNDGIIGAFINLIDIPKEYGQAFQILSGSSFQDIVVTTSEVAQELIEILKEKKLGRASFLALDSIKVFKINDKLPKIEGVIDFARNLVKYDKKIDRVIEFVFGNAVVVKNIEIGRKLLKEGYNDRIVTLDGDIITARGRITGGYTVKGKDELLERKTELNEIEIEIKKIEIKNNEYEKKLLEIKNRIEKGEALKGEKVDENTSILNKFREFILDFDNFNNDYNRKQNQINTLGYEISENDKIIENRKNKINENINILEKIDEFIIENEKNIKEIENKLEKIEDLSEYTQKLNIINTEYEILKVKTESNEQRYLEIEKDYIKLLNEQTELEKFEIKKEEIKDKLKNDILEKEKLIEEKSNENKKMNENIKILEEEIKNIELTEKKLITELKNVEVKMVGYQLENEKIIEKITKNDNDIKYYNLELEEINIEKIKENLEYKKIEDEVELQSIRRKLSMNEKSRTDIGPVNLSAIDEYEKENNRYIEMVDQKRDLLHSRELLFSLIKDIEFEISSKFSHAFEEINKNFEYMCKKILNEAKGIIKLTNPENILETGLELSVKYKNKPEQTLMLLSGGEKSMLAVSFIMAIFMFKPSPFTFFDEIEAALDEVNTKKIVELLNKFIEKSQFILITHNKETMKGSHRLYGVTMNKEIGESRLISVDV